MDLENLGTVCRLSMKGVVSRHQAVNRDMEETVKLNDNEDDGEYDSSLPGEDWS
jgi:hypothetical protein